MTGLVQAWNSLTTQLYQSIVSILIPTAILLAAICLFTMFLGKDEKKVAAAREWLKRIVFGTAAILLLGFIASVLYNAISSANTNGIGLGGMFNPKP